MASDDYGRLSLFRDPASLDRARAREVAFQNLEARGKSPDEVAARAEYLDLLGVQTGQRVLDVGCGSGVVTRDIARRVAPNGRAVGVDPHGEFLAIARELAREERLDGVAEFREGSALALPFRDGEFDAAVAATVLVHVPGGEGAIPEMARVVRRGGRVGVFDFDGDSLVISHPDRPLTRRIVAAFSDHAAVDGWLVRRLPGVLTEAGLARVAVRAFLPLEREPDGFYARMAERAADVAAQAGAITEADRDRWLAQLRAEQAAGRFLGGRVHVFCWGVKP
jgi:ubiquinone/menaquinone biosynthesis C-methylase UbiE